MSAFSALIKYFPSNEQAEVNGAISELANNRLISTPWDLANASQVTIGSALSGYSISVFFGPFYVEVNGIAASTWAKYKPKDPNNPTPREQQNLDNIWNLFYQNFNSDRLPPIKEISENYQLDTIKATFEQFTTLKDADLFKFADDTFFQLLASYYILVSKRFTSSTLAVIRPKGRIVDSKTSKGISNIKISATDQTTGVSLGSSVTNAGGYFDVTDLLLTAPTKNYNIHLDISGDGINSKTATLVYDPTNPDNVQDVSVDSVPYGTTANISTVASGLGITIPSQLQTYLTANSITTLADIRSAGGLKNRTDLNFDKSNPILLQLDGLANLELLNEDYTKNNDLYQRGYTSILEVGTAARSKFVEANKDVLPTYDIAQYHFKAEQVTKLAMTSAATVHDALNPRKPSNIEVNTNCGCSDCHSAVSPLAYLADLEQYVKDNLRDGTTVPDLNWLQTNFYQLFADLPASCDALDEDICQSRIATEVLYGKYLTIEGSLPQSKINALNASIQEYLNTAYEDLLRELGTSYDELRDIQHASDTDKKSLANSLGMALNVPSTSNDCLKVLFVDITSTPGVTADFLKTTFGLRPITENPITPLPESWVHIFKEAYLRELWKESDYSSNDYRSGTKPVIDPDIVTVDDFRLPDENNSMPFKIWKARRTFVDDDVLTLFRTLTTYTDFFAKMTGSNIFTYTNGSGTGVPIGQLWNSSDPAGDLKALNTSINSGSQDDVTTLWNEFKLLPSELNQLVSIINASDAAGTSGNPGPIPDSMLSDMQNIMGQSVKRGVWDIWLSEESTNSVTLSPDIFWESTIDPVVGDWPILITATSDLPLIDPELINTDQLIEETAWTLLNPSLLNTFNNRVTALSDFMDQIKGTLKTDFGGTLVNTTNQNKTVYPINPTVFKYKWDTSASPVDKSFQHVYQQLNDPSNSSTAKTTIQDIFKLSVDDFVLMMSMGEAADSQSADNYSDSDWQYMYSVLTTVHKKTVLYGYSGYTGWIKDDANGEVYWKVRKGQLPKWRASVSERDQWLRALEQNSAEPIINPDEIGPAFLANPIDGDAAYDLWSARYDQMHSTSGWLTTIGANSLASLSDFDTLTQHYIMSGVLLDLNEIYARSLKGDDISKRLSELTLTPTTFNYLINKRNVLAGGDTLTDDEKDGVYKILANIQRMRQYYAYSVEEETNDITLSQDYFKPQTVDYYQIPPENPYPIDQWLGSETHRSAWLRTLNGRIDQEDSLNNSLLTLLRNNDDDNMQQLRDAYVTACGDDSLILSERARKLGDELLIDLQNNCCSSTNHISQAIETLQQLVWKTRSGDILAYFSNMTLIVSDFEESWQWVGSYANWRAAMFVFLYPENVLLPSLRNEQTPAFQDIVNETLNNRNFTPDTACSIAKYYQDYIRDVSTLELICSVQANVITGVDKCNSEKNKIEYLTFIFAKSSNSGLNYYCVVDANTEDELHQRAFWTVVPNTDKTATVQGADFYRGGHHQESHHIYVFFTTDDPTKQDTFYATRFDVDNNIWEEAPIEYKVQNDELLITASQNYSNPPSNQDFIMEIKALVVAQNTWSYDSPLLAITLANTKYPDAVYTFYRSLSATGKDFETGEYWDKWQTFFNYLYDKKYSSKSLEGYVKRLVKLSGEVYSDDVYCFQLSTSNGNNSNYNIPLIKNVFYTPNGAVEIDPNNNDGIYMNLDQLFTVPGASVPGVEKVFFFKNDPYGDANSIWTMVLEPNYQTPSQFGNSYQLVNGDYYISQMNYERTDLPTNTLLIYQERDSHSKPQNIKAIRLKYNTQGNKEIHLSGNALQLNPEGTEAISITPVGEEENSESNAFFSKTIFESNAPYGASIMNYVKEASYFVPLKIAMQLNSNGYYQDALDWFRAIYDYTKPLNERNIYYGLTAEETISSSFIQPEYWYKDPLNPHQIASTRAYAYTRYTLLCLIQTLLAYADSEFTKDTSESVPRARELYEDALDLLALLKPEDLCNTEYTIYLLNQKVQGETQWKRSWKDLFSKISQVQTDQVGLQNLYDNIVSELDSSHTTQVKYANVKSLIYNAISNNPHKTYTDIASTALAQISKRMEAAIGRYEMDQVITRSGGSTGMTFDRTMSQMTGFTKSELQTKDLSWFYTPGQPAEQASGRMINPLNVKRPGMIGSFAYKSPVPTFELNSPFPAIRLSGMSFVFCAVTNPVIEALTLSANANLYKIHNCMNIAGMQRELSPFAAPTDSTTGIPVIGAGGTLNLNLSPTFPPSGYKYDYLVNRAKQLVSLAQQMEATFLAALEKFDAETYTALRAEQDLESSRANVQLQNLKVNQANDNVQLATLQRDRATIQVNGLQGMIDAGLLGPERNQLTAYAILGASQIISATFQAAEQTQQNLTIASSAGGGVTATASVGVSMVFANLANAANALALTAKIAGIAASTSAQISSIYASLARRKQEWRYEKSIAQQDVKIGNQQIQIAQDGVQIATQEQTIVNLQQTHAQATLDFLKNKFTNAQLYEWMSGILQGVYSYFLQEATSVAKMAERQLAFKSQLSLPGFIRSDYWNVPSSNSLSGIGTGNGPDRKGLTGAERLLEDLTKLDEYAFNNDSRKLQIRKVISLNELDPVRMQQLRETGEMDFKTTEEMFDRDYPGHYLRLIKRVSITVIALTPPTDGIKATLMNGGNSTVVTGGVVFQPKDVVRYPEEIALSSPSNDYGVFNLQPDPKFLFPFEGSGVATSWTFRMEKAANQFDFDSIADVLMTIEYEALNSFTYRSFVTSRLNNNPRQNALIFSFKNNLPDQWYELSNPNTSDTPMAVTFDVKDSDLAPNVTTPAITKMSLYLSLKVDPSSSSTSPRLPSSGNGLLTQQVFTPDLQNNLDTQYNFELKNQFTSSNPTGGSDAGGSGLNDLVGMDPRGKWSFVLPTSSIVQALFDGTLDDILLVFYYDGDTIKYLN